MNWPAYIAPTLFVLHWLATFGVALRVLSKRRSQGVSLAWLAVLAWIPIVGIVLYILVGEAWLTRRRARRMRNLEESARNRFRALDRYAATEDDDLRPFLAPLNRLSRATSPIPTLVGNTIDLLDDADAFFPALLDAIATAEHSINLLFFIDSPGARVDKVHDALITAAKRGVTVRLLVDAVGSKPLLKNRHAMDALKSAGVQVRPALPVRFPRQLFARVDLRNHRKLVVIDTKIAFTGSMNLADPTVFKQSADVGQWVDIMARVRGPAVHALDLLFALDWCVEHDDENLHASRPKNPETPGPIPVQILSSGPGDEPDDLRRVLLQSIYAAREEIVISTPYFVPDDTLLTSLITASHRGVDVTIIVPDRVDSKLVAHASRSYYDDLIAAGVHIRHFTLGLLHAKTAVIDNRLTLIGSANLDRRSLWINFELSLFAHDESTAAAMRKIQNRYIAASMPITIDTWGRRPLHWRLIDNAAQLLAPIL